MKFLIAILFALFPVLSWGVQYYFSKKDKQFNLFKKNSACFYSDFFFIPVNFAFVYLFKFSNIVFLFLSISLVANIAGHIFWAKENRSGKRKSHMYNNKKSRLNESGVMHFLFSFTEMIIVFYLFYISIPLNFILVTLLPILLYGISLVFLYYLRKGKPGKTDFITMIFITIIIIAKIFLL